ncbi:MAG: type II secretion system protein [Rariglobus sp.]|nr:type II secretion system protein [Rariglobus sp.]
MAVIPLLAPPNCPLAHFPRRSFSSKHYGFTLTELLVVIAIVSILAALVLAGLVNIKRTAQRNACASNKRQVWQATLLYSQDNKGFLPSSASGSVGPTTINGVSTADRGTIARKLAPYIPDSFWEDPDPVNYAASHLEGGSQFGSVWKKVTGYVATEEKFNPYNRNPNDNNQGYRLASLAQPQLVGVLDCQDVPSATGDDQIPHGRANVRLYADGRTELQAKR